MKVVICGGGIIGCATAFYLSKLSSAKIDITIIEKESIACHSSGKAGGFLALDWNDHSDVGPLARLSYKLHQELSASLGEELHYRQLKTFSIDAGKAGKSSKPSDSWINSSIRSKKVIGTEKSTAQVTPKLLTDALFKASGAQLIQGSVSDIKTLTHSFQVSVANQDSVDADIVVIAMGAWSAQAGQFFPKAKPVFAVSGSKAHSIIVEGQVPPEALFIHLIDENGRSKEPEIYPRPDGTIYICGESDGSALPDHPGDIQPREEACQKLYSMTEIISPQLAGAEIKTKQACYLPCSADGVPIIGPIPNYDKAFLASGHGCWGILNGPATGKCLAQLILGQKVELDLEPFSPTRFMK